MNTILITNGTGFLGSNLIRYFLEHTNHTIIAGYRDYKKITIEKNDNLRWEPVSYLTNVRYHVDTVVHNAGLARGDKLSDLLESNVKLTDSFLSVYQHTRFIHISSSAVYGDCPTPRKETDIPLPTSKYGVSKLAGEALVSAQTARGRVNGVIIRPCAIVGPGAKSGLLPDVIRKLNEPGDTIQLFGPSPGAVKSYVHVNDICHLIEYLVSRERFYTGILNAAPQDSISVSDVVRIVERNIHKNKKKNFIKNNLYFLGDNEHVALDSSKSSRMIEFYLGSESAISYASMELQNEYDNRSIEKSD